MVDDDAGPGVEVGVVLERDFASVHGGIVLDRRRDIHGNGQPGEGTAVAGTIGEGILDIGDFIDAVE